MRSSEFAFALLCASALSSAAPVAEVNNYASVAEVIKSHKIARSVTGPAFDQGQPIDGEGRGAPFSGWKWSLWTYLLGSNSANQLQDGTNHQLDLQNPDNLGRADDTDNGVVPNLKWSFSDSHTRLFKGGWIRESVVTDLPSSPDISSAQVHLSKGALRELHWHSVVSHYD